MTCFYLLLSVVPLYADSVGVGGVGAALAGLAVVPGLPGREPTGEPPVGVLAGLRTPALFRPAVTFSTTAMAAGVVVTFLPLAVPGARVAWPRWPCSSGR